MVKCKFYLKRKRKTLYIFFKNVLPAAGIELASEKEVIDVCAKIDFICGKPPQIYGNKLRNVSETSNSQ